MIIMKISHLLPGLSRLHPTSCFCKKKIGHVETQYLCPICFSSVFGGFHTIRTEVNSCVRDCMA